MLGEFGVNAAAAEKQQPAGAGLPGRLHHVGLEVEVLQQEIGRASAVGLNATDGGGRQYNHIGLVGMHPGADGQTIEKIQLLSAGGEQRAATCWIAIPPPRQRAADGTASHAAGTGNEDAIAGADQRHGGCFCHSRAPTTWKPLAWR